MKMQFMEWAWVIWFTASMLAFGGLEAFARKTGHTTLSTFVRTISEHWPPFVFLMGLVVGGLAVHFWWSK